MEYNIFLSRVVVYIVKHHKIIKIKCNFLKIITLRHDNIHMLPSWNVLFVKSLVLQANCTFHIDSLLIAYAQLKDLNRSIVPKELLLVIQ